MNNSFENELDELLIALKSDKPQKRNKAFDRFSKLLTNQLQDVQRTIENGNQHTWDDYLKAAHQGRKEF